MVGATAPPAENDYTGILSKLVDLFEDKTITITDLKPIVEKLLCKLFGDHGQELFAVGMLVDDANRGQCKYATLAGNDRISYCRLLHMLKYAKGANTGDKAWAAIYNSAASYNMVYKPNVIAFLKKNRKKKSKRSKRKTKKTKRHNKKTNNRKKKSKKSKKSKKTKNKSISKIQYIYNFFK